MGLEIRSPLIARRSRLRVGFVCFGRKTFDLELAENLANSSKRALEKQSLVTWSFVDNLITDVNEASKAAESLIGKIDILVAQFNTFVDARFVDTMASVLHVPFTVWAVREPNEKNGQRLSLNSLTGANMAGHRLTQLGIPFEFLYGSPEDIDFNEKLSAALRFWIVWSKLHRFHVVSLGEPPDGFFFSSPHENVLNQLGITVETVDLDDTFRRALQISDEESSVEYNHVKSKVVGLEELPVDSVVKFAKMITMLKRNLEEQNVDAVAVRCWPEFFTKFGAAACSTVSALTEFGIMSAQEGDILGSLSMDVLYCLTNSPSYLGDLVEIDEMQQAVVFWHCGAGAFSLARQDTGALAGKHPNRNIGFTLNFGLKPGRVTILRVGEDSVGNVRVLIGSGEVLDESQRFQGTSGKVRLAGDGDIVARVTQVIEAGFEPHYALAYGDVAATLERLFRLMNIPVTRF